MSHDIIITNARTNNLKNISISIPKNQLVVVTGPSGSGKTSLIYDTLYHESQRRFIESLSSFAKNIIGQISAPDVDSIEHLTPAIALKQGFLSLSPRSTIGTMTDIYDHFRLLFAKIGKPHCPVTKTPLLKWTPTSLTTHLLSAKIDSRVSIYAYPTVGSSFELFINQLLAIGMTRIFFNNELVELETIDQNLLKDEKRILILIDRLQLKVSERARLHESLELAFNLGQDVLSIDFDGQFNFYAKGYFSFETNIFYPPLTPTLFSFNSPQGACSTCTGLGKVNKLNLESAIQDKTLSIATGAVPLIQKNKKILEQVTGLLLSFGLEKSVPLCDLPHDVFHSIFYGNSTFEGIESILLRENSDSIAELFTEEVCSSCQGGKLNHFAQNVLINGHSISTLNKMTLSDLYQLFFNLELSSSEKILCEKVIQSLLHKLSLLIQISVDYLTLDRSCATLSAGEAQRIKLATLLGNSLSGITYIFDEPSKGLHPSDQEKLIPTLKALTQLGNNVICIEHTPSFMLSADYLIEMGPKSGDQGGEVVFSGTLTELLQKETPTAQLLKSKPEFNSESSIFKKFLSIKNANINNVKNLSLDIPLNTLTAICGVSGSGKSSFALDLLLPVLKKLTSRKSHLSRSENFDSITGYEQLSGILEINQSSISKTSSSIPVTFLGVFDHIRELFSQTRDSLLRGYSASRFSFNTKGGRCEECEGSGTITIEMHFMDNVEVVCPECQGKKYNQETLLVQFKGKSIADVLELSFQEAELFFCAIPSLFSVFKTANALGLGHLRLGQSSKQLSGGESQRLKLARELSKRTKGSTLFILDEPSSGLFYLEIELLYKSLRALIAQGHSVLMIEHNPILLRRADYLFEMGPGAAHHGGKLISYGTPTEVKKSESSIIKNYL